MIPSCGMSRAGYGSARSRGSCGSTTTLGREQTTMTAWVLRFIPLLNPLAITVGLPIFGHPIPGFHDGGRNIRPHSVMDITQNAEARLGIVRENRTDGLG
jgi:hypothetical protein